MSYTDSGGGFVYLVFDAATGAYKLGQTANLDERLRLLAAATAGDLSLVWYIATNDHVPLETEWKRHWSAKRIKSEWFRLSESDVLHFKSFRTVRYLAQPDAEVPNRDPLDLSGPKSPMSRRKLRPPIRIGHIIPSPGPT